MDINSFVIGYKKGKASAPTGGGVELNIAYGDTEPADTTKLWVKTSEPSGVLVSPEVEETQVGEESVVCLPEVLPTKLESCGAVVVGNKVYLLGGRNGSSCSSSVISYDLKTKEIEVFEGALERPFSGTGCAAVGTRIYFFGGHGYNNDSDLIQYFDTETKKVVTCTAKIPVAMYDAIGGSIENAVYIMGGRTSRNVYPTTIYKYDTVDDTIQELSNLAQNECNAPCVRVGETFYIASGAVTGTYLISFNTVTLSSTKNTNILNGITSYPNSSRAGGFGAVGKYLYYIAPQIDQSNVYRINAEDWTEKEKLSVEVPSTIGFMPSSVSIGDKIYMFGGKAEANINSNTYIDKIHLYSQESFAPLVQEGTLYVKQTTEDNVFPVVNAGGMAVEVGVDTVYKGNAEGIGEPVEAAIYKDGAWTTI